MKCSFYVDTYPGMDTKFLCAFANPSKKTDNTTRYRIDFELPDPCKPDVVIDDVEITKIIEGGGSVDGSVRPSE